MILRDARDVYVAGIGASWNAGLAILSFFSKAGLPACLVDASELSGRIASSMAWRDIVPGGVPGGTFRASRQSRTRKSAPESERRSARGDERIAAGALGSDNVFREYEEIEGRAPSSHSIQKRSARSHNSR